MGSAVDDGVGDLLAKIDEHGLATETLVFFLSDNGGPIRKTSNGAANTPLRGGKGGVFEGGVRVPFAMRWTGTVPAGIDYRQPVSSLYIMATAVGINGLELAAPNPLDGVNLVPFLLDTTDNQITRNFLFWRVPVRGRDNTKLRRFGALMGSSKLVNNSAENLLFDLSKDPSEVQELSAARPDRANQLNNAWQQWNAQMAPESAVPLSNEW